MIDIKEILTKYGIKWNDKGHNTGRGEVSLHCPLCGPEDKSDHLGINLTTGYWSCWRNRKHSSKQLRILFSILKIPLSELEEANSILSKLLDGTYFEEGTVEAEEVKERKRFTSLPEGFINLAEDASCLARPYLRYLQIRGFSAPLEVAKQFNLCRSMFAGKWSARLIVPVCVNDEVSWTARAISPYNTLRYLSPTEEEARPIKDCIFDYNRLDSNGGKVLLITEGCFDALKVTWFCQPEVLATCIYGLVAIDSQIKLLEAICPKFDKVLIGLDDGTLTQSLTLMRQLCKWEPTILHPPKKDWGESNIKEIKEVLSRYL